MSGLPQASRAACMPTYIIPSSLEQRWDQKTQNISSIINKSNLENENVLPFFLQKEVRSVFYNETVDIH